jgi:hypothetical protein
MKNIPQSNRTCGFDRENYCGMQGFQSGPVPGTFTHLRSCIVPAEITEPPKISGGQNHNVCNAKCWLDSLVVYEKTYCILNLEICFEEHLENILSIHMNK